MSIYVKTSGSATLLSGVDEINNELSTQEFKLGNLHVVLGCKCLVTSAGRDWIKLFDITELQHYFGPAFNIERIHVQTFNADSKALNSHFYPPEIYYSGDFCVYQYYYPSTKSQIDVRINYALWYYS